MLGSKSTWACSLHQQLKVATKRTKDYIVSLHFKNQSFLKEINVINCIKHQQTQPALPVTRYRYQGGPPSKIKKSVIS